VYNSFVSGRQGKVVNRSIRFANGKVYINCIEGFWSYAKKRLLKFHGVSRKNFVYYLKVLEFRYNIIIERT